MKCISGANLTGLQQYTRREYNSLWGNLMAEDRFRVILTGYSTGKGEYYIEADFAGRFNMTAEKAKTLFDAVPTILKEDLSFEQANQYKDSVEKTGGLCEIESMKFNFSGLSLE